MTEAVNSSEQWVYDICRKSFLSLWSYVNPQGRAGKELCDILVVCDPHVPVISVKEVTLSDTGDVSVEQACIWLGDIWGNYVECVSSNGVECT
jgi:hypothetical protein